MPDSIVEAKLADLKYNPHNYRTKFDGPEFDALVESIRQTNVIQPVLIRSVEGKKKYEIVFGERRVRASRKAGKKTIPAIVKNLCDKEAYNLMIVENFHRDDLTELDEANGFRLYLKNNGDEALGDLAERTGIKPAYIRRRVSVLSLPESVLEAWGNGEILYGYLEQLARLNDEAEILELFESIMDGYDIDSIRELKQIIDNQAIKFEHAVFDITKTGCLTCASNTDVQLNLFEIDAEATKCLNAACFKEKQTSWLVDNWGKSKFKKKFKTTGFRFSDDVDRSQCGFFQYKDMVGKDCYQCDGFVTLCSGPSLNVFSERVCIGDSACLKKHCAQARKKASGEVESKEGQGDEPRVSWHGGHFREIFYTDQIPVRFKDLAVDSLDVAQLQLFALVKSNSELRDWFINKYKVGKKSEFGYATDTELFSPILKMTLEQVAEAQKEAVLQVVLFRDFYAEGRCVVADHVGIDLSKEWLFTEEYLQKKTIGEMLGFGERFGIFSDPKAVAYLADVVKKKKFKGCRKPELIAVFLKSGVDLTGKVPHEILNRD